MILLTEILLGQLVEFIKIINKNHEENIISFNYCCYVLM